MIVIYDFDGTLTPYSLPQYSILKNCGYDEVKFMDRVEQEQEKTDLYTAYWKCYKNILLENNIEISKENICFEADKVKLNNGVLDYFNKFRSSNTCIKHYIVTSGVEDYVKATPIGKLVDGIYGTTIDKNNVNILSDIDKVDIIKMIQQNNQIANDIIYFGDGLTDKLAFQYVHKIGGINVFVKSNEKSISNYKKMADEKIIDKCFSSDFGENSEIDKFMEKWGNK